MTHYINPISTSHPQQDEPLQGSSISIPSSMPDYPSPLFPKPLAALTENSSSTNSFRSFPTSPQNTILDNKFSALTNANIDTCKEPLGGSNRIPGQYSSPLKQTSLEFHGEIPITKPTPSKFMDSEQTSLYKPSPSMSQKQSSSISTPKELTINQQASAEEKISHDDIHISRPTSTKFAPSQPTSPYRPPPLPSQEKASSITPVLKQTVGQQTTPLKQASTSIDEEIPVAKLTPTKFSIAPRTSCENPPPQPSENKFSATSPAPVPVKLNWSKSRVAYPLYHDNNYPPPSHSKKTSGQQTTPLKQASTSIDEEIPVAKLTPTKFSIAPRTSCENPPPQPSENKFSATSPAPVPVKLNWSKSRVAYPLYRDNNYPPPSHSKKTSGQQTTPLKQASTSMDEEIPVTKLTPTNVSLAQQTRCEKPSPELSQKKLPSTPPKPIKLNSSRSTVPQLVYRGTNYPPSCHSKQTIKQNTTMKQAATAIDEEIPVAKLAPKTLSLAQQTGNENPLPQLSKRKIPDTAPMPVMWSNSRIAYPLHPGNTYPPSSISKQIVAQQTTPLKQPSVSVDKELPVTKLASTSITLTQETSNEKPSPQLSQKQLPIASPMQVELNSSKSTVAYPENKNMPPSQSELAGFTQFSTKPKLHQSTPVSKKASLATHNQPGKRTFLPIKHAVNLLTFSPNPTPRNISHASTVPAAHTFSLRRINSDSALHNLKRYSSPLTGIATRQDLLALPIRARKEEYNEDAAQQFAAHIVSAVNDAATCILISIGHQLGLFAVLARLNSRAHSVRTIANAARHLHARYVQEWLSSMACVGIVQEELIQSDMAGQYVRKYRLPAEHAVFLTWGDQSNMALLSQYIPVLGRLEDAVVGCFRSGCGLDISRYAHFNSVASLDAVQTLGPEDGSRVLQYVEGLAEMLQDGACVLCIGGVGDGVYIQLAKRYGKSWFTCYDAHVTQMKASQRLLQESGGGCNVHFRTLANGLEGIEERRTYDAALVLDGSSVRNAKNPVEVLKGIKRALRKGGPVILVEAVAEGNLKGDRGHCAGTFLYGVSAMQGLPCEGGKGGVGDDAVGGVWGVENAKRGLEMGGFADVQAFAMEDGFNCVIVGTAGDGKRSDE